jgi:hypothetical protein
VIEGEFEYTVGTILAHDYEKEGRQNKLILKVSWEGYESYNNSSEWEDNLTNCPEILIPYKRKHILL